MSVHKLVGSKNADRRILLAEDDDAIAQLLLKVLGKHYVVHHARDGLRAVTLAFETQPQLLILDVAMPGLDGYQVARRVRANPMLRTIPIIFLTAKVHPTDLVKGIQAGARHYITKPFKMDDLLTKTQKILAA